MPQLKQFTLPDVGEGLTEAEIVSWKVKPGDTVAVNDTIVEIETAKSLVELPCPFAGVVTELHAPEGETVAVGTTIITVDVDPTGPAAATPPSAPSAPTVNHVDDLVPAVPVVPDGPADIPVPGPEQAVEPGLIGGPAPGGRTSVLVGYGPRETSAVRRPRKGAPAAPVSTEATPAVAAVLAKPPVRKLAKDLGVDLATVTATGPGGVVTRADLEAARGGPPNGTAPTQTPQGAAATAAPAPPAWSDGERELRVPVKGVRRMTAQAMVTSAFTAPHVTEFVTVDVTRTMKLVERLRADRAFADVRVSPLLLVARALLLAVRRNPEINASWDDAAQEIVLKRYVNLGIAAATPRGLVVPNVKDADRLSLHDLAAALNSLTETAKSGRTQPGDMAGGTITITNVGVFGVDTGTPILNPGEAAILALGAVRDMPWVHKGRVRPRKVTQLGLSFDHRLVDGELGSRFLADLATVLEHPSTALLWA